MAALTIAQDEKGWLSTETMDFVAQYLGMPPIAVYEVATFYNMYNLKPVGKHKLCICTNLPCALSGATEAAAASEAASSASDLERNHRRRPVHAEGRRVHGRLRRCAGAAGQQQDAC